MKEKKIKSKIVDHSKREKEIKKNKVLIQAVFCKDMVISENSSEAKELYNQSRYGVMLDNGKVQMSLIEAAYLMEKNSIKLFSESNRAIDIEKFIKKANKVEPNFHTRYCVFKNMRNRGYIVKTALKFGADFRVYDRGIKPGEDHAKWIVYPVKESSVMTWYDFSAKNRVAHSTKKKLLLGVVDDEGDCTYYEVRWVRP
jgi:tRNA-intron endonuclease, archaea type